MKKTHNLHPTGHVAHCLKPEAELQDLVNNQYVLLRQGLIQICFPSRNHMATFSHCVLVE